MSFMSDYLTAPLAGLSALFDEEIELHPAGTKIRAVLSGQMTESVISPSGNGYISMTSVRFVIQKSEATIAARSVFNARSKRWRVETLRDDDTAWSGTAFEWKGAI